MHGPNERMRLSDLMTMAKIYTHVILELCGQ
jgi:acetylornithine deacetylase/succinyl-diaminopimelate desuccinylase-like protein